MKASTDRSRRSLIILTLLAIATTLGGPLPVNGMYNSKHGRWLQRDPLGVRPDPPTGVIDVPKQYTDGMTLYEYVRNMPTHAQDPTGTIIVGLDGWDVLPISGKGHINTIGKKIEKEVNRWRRQKRLQPDKYVFIRGFAGEGADDIAREAAAYRLRRFTPEGKRRCHVESFVLFGYSDGATSIYKFFNDNLAYYALKAKDVVWADSAPGVLELVEPPLFAAVSYVGMIDMVRGHVPEGLGELDKSQSPYSSRSLDMNGQWLVRNGDVFYQDAVKPVLNPFLWITSGWKGYNRIGSFARWQTTPSNHVDIIGEPSMQQILIRHAVDSYVEHAEEQLKRNYNLFSF